MIQKMTSKDVMEILSNAKQSVSDMNSQIILTKNEIETRLAVIKNTQSFLTQQVQTLQNQAGDGYNTKISNKIVFPTADIQAGTYELFGTTICPKSLSTATDIFNLKTETGTIFKNNAIVKVNEQINDTFKYMLMDDSTIGKGISFEEFSTPDIVLEVAVNPNDLLGSTDFNTIKILPYIPGSLTLKQIEVYDMQGYLANEIFPVLTIKRDIENFGAMKILIDRTRTLYKLVLTFHIDYRNSSGKYPFGIQHLLLLKENYDENSYAIVKVSGKKYIQSIGENLVITDQNGTYDSTIQEEGVELYYSYADGQLMFDIPVSHGLVENILSKTVKTFYVKIPIDRSITSINFTEIRTK